jgi:hypothetical protein
MVWTQTTMGSPASLCHSTAMKLFTLILLASVAIFLAGCGTTSKTSNIEAIEKEWFEGGTLRQATVSEWKAATRANKLATSGDFVVNTSEEFTSEGQLKDRATELMDCIDTAVANSAVLDNSQVSEVAATCAVLKASGT